MEDKSLSLITPPPEEKLSSWLAEFYGKPVEIKERQVLRRRDLSFVERLWVTDGLPQSLIYKAVLPPWDVEQDLHERVLIPSICNSAQLYLTAHHGEITAMLFEDLGSYGLKETCTPETAEKLGRELAKMHRAYSYRTDELLQMDILPTMFPLDYESFAKDLSQTIFDWQLITKEKRKEMVLLANLLAHKHAGEPISLVHGDLYAENLILHNGKLFIVDWSWFTMLGVPILDLATLTMNHIKNGAFTKQADRVIDAYCFESGRSIDEVKSAIPSAVILSRLLFLHWLVVRRKRGIMGTTVGPVDELIPTVVQELSSYLQLQL